MKLQDLKWFDGISWETPVNEVGWVWVLLALLLLFLGFISAHLLNDLKEKHEDVSR